MEENNNSASTPNNNPQPAAQPVTPANNSGITYENKTIITILLLVFVYPIGLIFMWKWMKWLTWVKVVLSVLVLAPFILAILLAITLIAINPARQFSQSNNTKRSADIGAILNSIGQYSADNRIAFPTIISSSPQEISSKGVNICSLLVPTYIGALPVDPMVNEGKAVTECSGSYDTGYTVSLGENGRVTVSAPKAELGRSISVTR